MANEMVSFSFKAPANVAAVLREKQSATDDTMQDFLLAVVANNFNLDLAAYFEDKYAAKREREAKRETERVAREQEKAVKEDVKELTSDLKDAGVSIVEIKRALEALLAAKTVAA